MRYLLVAVTHGASPHIAAALDSVRRNVSPVPARGLLWVDGPDEGDAALDTVAAIGLHSWTVTGSARQQGFCNTYADAWHEAVEEAFRFDCTHVLWLEADFVFERLVDVAALAELLRTAPGLAQVALMRNAVNEQEIAAGGLFESRRGEYEKFVVSVKQEPVVHGARLRGYPWLRHRSYFTTNPCLMTVDFMHAHPWPHYEAECEGLFTHDLLAEGLSFAVWGSGEPWVEHVGVRTGFGY